MKKMYWMKDGRPGNPEQVAYMHRASGRTFGVVRFTHVHKMWRAIRCSPTEHRIIEEVLVDTQSEARKYLRTSVNCYR